MVELRQCTDADIPKLAEMNALLDEAVEDACNTPRKELEHTMADALNKHNHKAFFFLEGGEVVGYALCDMRQQPVYIRQFFIGGGHRGRGAGQAAFGALAHHLGAKELSLDVHCSNATAIAFWKKLGFTEKHVRMRWAGGEGA